MHLLLTSDLHRDGAKLLWLLENADKHDALLIAGDLLDIFSNTGFVEQKDGALKWKSALFQTGKPFAWCSGNHDFFEDVHTPVDGVSPLWMREEPSTATFVTDGESRLLETACCWVVVTTIPWPVHGCDIVVDGASISYLDFVNRLMVQGQQLRAKRGGP